MSDMQSDSRLDEFVQAFDSIDPTGDRGEDLGKVLEAAIRLGGGDRGHAILMKKNTVTTEITRTAAGVAFEVDDEIRKAAARHGIAVQEGKAPSVERDGDRVSFPVALNDKEGATITLLGVPADGVSDLGGAFVYCAGRFLALSEETRGALTRVSEAEASITRGGVGAVAYLKPVAELERDAIELALKSCSWNKEEAARRLGISRASIYMKVKKFGLQSPPKESDTE